MLLSGWVEPAGETPSGLTQPPHRLTENAFDKAPDRPDGDRSWLPPPTTKNANRRHGRLDSRHQLRSPATARDRL